MPATWVRSSHRSRRFPAPRRRRSPRLRRAKHRHVDRPCDRHSSPHDRHVAPAAVTVTVYPAGTLPLCRRPERLLPPPRPRSSRAWCGSRAARTRWGWSRRLPTLITRPPAGDAFAVLDRRARGDQRPVPDLREGNRTPSANGLVGWQLCGGPARLPGRGPRLCRCRRVLRVGWQTGPTEAEWEVAGPAPASSRPCIPGRQPTADGRVYQLSREDTYPVGSATFNRSPFGVYDMAGNVWEWVDQPYLPVASGSRCCAAAGTD